MRRSVWIVGAAIALLALMAVTAAQAQQGDIAYQPVSPSDNGSSEPASRGTVVAGTRACMLARCRRTNSYS